MARTLALALVLAGCSGGSSSTGELLADGAAGDRCAATTAGASGTAGCNGGFAGPPAANGPLGECTTGTDTMPSGSCTTPGAVCTGHEDGSPGGTCTVLCTPPETDVATGDCPQGFRCFRIGTGETAYGQCFRDCDAAHACPGTLTCASTARCE